MMMRDDCSRNLLARKRRIIWFPSGDRAFRSQKARRRQATSARRQNTPVTPAAIGEADVSAPPRPIPS